MATGPASRPRRFRARSPGPSPSTVAPGTVVFRDGFIDNAADWDEGSFSGANTTIEDGSLVIRFDEGGNPTPVPHVARLASLRDVSVAVTATQTNASPASFASAANGWGVSCRWNQDSSYYFLIAAGGDWSIQKTAPGQGKPHLSDGTNANVIHTGEPNTIRGVCIDDGSGVRLELFVDGTSVGSAHDPKPNTTGGAGVLAAGSVGVAAIGQPGLRIRFDDFKVVAQ